MRKLILGALSIMGSTVPAAFVAGSPTKVEWVMGGLTGLFLLAGQNLVSTGLEEIFDARSSKPPHVVSPSIVASGPGGAA